MVFAGANILRLRPSGCATWLCVQLNYGRRTQTTCLLMPLLAFCNFFAHYVLTMLWFSFDLKVNSRAANTINWISTRSGTMGKSIVSPWKLMIVLLHFCPNRILFLRL